MQLSSGGAWSAIERKCSSTWGASSARHAMTHQDGRSPREAHEDGGGRVDQLDEDEDAARARQGDAELAVHERERRDVAAPERDDLHEEVRSAGKAERPSRCDPLALREQEVQPGGSKRV